METPACLHILSYTQTNKSKSVKKSRTHNNLKGFNRLPDTPGFFICYTFISCC